MHVGVWTNDKAACLYGTKGRPAGRADGHDALAPSPLSEGKPSPPVCELNCDYRLYPNRDTTNCAAVPSQTFRRVPGRCEATGTAWGNPRHGRVQLSWGSFVQARRGRPGGERFARESFILRGVNRKIWSCAARSVSDWGLVHPL
eukprot:1018693-Pyramimonas_sp.AAC.1